MSFTALSGKLKPTSRRIALEAINILGRANTTITMARETEALPLLRGTTTLKSALEEEDDMLLDLNYPDQRIDFFVSLFLCREEIENIASFHLGLGSSDTCKTGEVNDWIHGSFNVCIPLYVNKPNQDPEKRALIRFPLPYKVGELKHPGNADEKLRCEAATFIWMQEHCPEISIPQLWGFGLVGGQSVRKLKLILSLVYTC